MIDRFWQDLPPAPAGKTLYLMNESKEVAALLKKKGYTVVDPRTLPRETDSENQTAVLAWLQGSTEGTLTLNNTQLKSLQIEAKAAGLLDGKMRSSMGINVNLNVEDTNDLVELLGWKESRHTLKNSTVQQIESAAKLSVIPGKGVKKL